ncbi:MAG: ribosome biogenesis GTPase YlqF [Bacilli bacterium]
MGKWDKYKKNKPEKNDSNSLNNGMGKTVINWYPGHMAKTKREIIEKLNLIDVVYEVIDARMPLSSKIVDIDELIKDKPRILVMTKYDLCDKVETDKIIKYYENMGYKVVPVDLMSGLNVKRILDYTKEIMDIENKKRESKGMKPRAARALIVGVPNAGKSTLINRLVGKKSAGVGNTPGFTKSLSWIRINKDVELLDSPGILWPKMEDQEAAHVLACLSSIKEEILDTDAIAAFILKKLYELYPDRLEDRYGIVELDEDLIESYDMIAKKRGALSRGGVADYDKVSNIIIRDLKNGYFGNITFDRLDVKK